MIYYKKDIIESGTSVEHFINNYILKHENCLIMDRGDYIYLDFDNDTSKCVGNVEYYER